MPLDRIRRSVPPPTGDPTAADEKTRKFTLPELRNQRYELQTRHLDNEHWLRVKGFRSLFWMTVGWLTGVFVLLLLQGFAGGRPDAPWFRLSDRVTLAVLGVTTANVLGVFLVAANYLFPRKPWWLASPHRRRR